MTKTYKINGRKIEVEEIYSSLNELAFLELLKALSDKEEPKQEECKTCGDNNPYKMHELCTKYDKQSTSLKEGITEIVSHSISVHTITDSVLKLIQSHLLKEIPCKAEDDDNSLKSKYWKQGYNEYREDIIKIINNI